MSFTLYHFISIIERGQGEFKRRKYMTNIEEILSKNVAEVIGKEEIIKKVEEGKKLKIKLGVDPTSADLHLGHAVVLRKLKEFQDAGQEVIFIVGDYTAKIGDPSGRNKVRPMQTQDEINQNAQTYLEQVGKVLDVDKATVKKNSEWFAELKLADIIKLASKLTIANILERDDFEERRKAGANIGLHEILYPLMQAYDSIMVSADVELGGTDQKFNLLTGRELMKKMDLSPQAIITMPILVGTDGTKKMSKSLGNYIALNDKPAEMYGKVMSLADKLIVQYFELCTDVTPDAVELIKKELNPPAGTEGKNPRDIKARLAKTIVTLYHDSTQAEEAESEFNRVFRDKEKPTEMPELNIKKSNYAIADLVQRAGAASLSEAKRLVEQGGVKINDEVISDPNVRLEPEEGMIIQIGKRRFFKIKLVRGE